MNCYLSITVVGPNVIVQCSCQKLHFVKRKGTEQEAIRMARAHVAESISRTKAGKYADFKGPTPDEVYAQRRKVLARYKPVREKQEGNSYMVHHIRIGS